MVKDARSLGVGLCILTLLWTGGRAEAGDSDFFENKIRPVMADHCFGCHGAKKKKGGLRLDSRAALLRGGDTGPAVKPGHPEKSILMVALKAADPDRIAPMPYKKKQLDAKVIADFESWIRAGATWGTAASPAAGTASKDFRKILLERKSKLPLLQPLRDPPAPRVKDARWAANPIDAFILHRLEAAGLKPAAPTERRTLLRRITFDLIGLPPTPEEIDAFQKDRSPDAFKKVVDRLLKSPHFGEKWARHWLDLVRYGESRGHEFDYSIANPHHYRDYVIRAYNQDVPYPQFVREHIAGDLLPKPRLHPTEGYSESVLGTGWWYLGEWIHSPVDIRGDGMDRVTNSIEVLGKTFLGLTVSCARCHDHKFDPISQDDFYALAGFLKSSNYRQVRFDAIEHNRGVARRLADLKKSGVPPLLRALHQARLPALNRLAPTLMAAREAILGGIESTPVKGRETVFEDFESGTYKGWKVEGTAFGKAPQTLKTISKVQGKINAVGTFFVNSYNVRNGGKGDKLTGKMTSRPFKIAHDWITFWAGGGAHRGKTCVNLLVGGKVVATGTGRNNNQMVHLRWNVRKWRGKQARIEVVDKVTGGWGNVGVDHIVFTDKPGKAAPARHQLSAAASARIAPLAAKRRVNKEVLKAWVEHLINARRDPADPLHAFAVIAGEKNAGPHLAKLAGKPVPPAPDPLKGMDVIADFRSGDATPLIQDGFSFARVRRGDVRIGTDAENPVARVFESGAAVTDPGWGGLKLAGGTAKVQGKVGYLQSGRTLRTSTFTLVHDNVYYLVRGTGRAFAEVDGHRLIQGPLHGSTTTGWKDSKFAWRGHNLRLYRSKDPAHPTHHVHAELTAESPEFEVIAVVQGPRPPALPGAGPNRAVQEAVRTSRSADDLAKRLQTLLRNVSSKSAAGTLGDSPEEAGLAAWIGRHESLFSPANDPGRRKATGLARAYIDARATLHREIKKDSRTAVAIMDGAGADEHLLVRGNHKNPARAVPRRFLEAIAGTEPISHQTGSGRLELARQMTDPKMTPLLPRVMVNRVWHHLFGRGLVPSVDDFGNMGLGASHPDLLDHLASRFTAEGGSIKKLIRSIVLTKTYGMSSAGSSPKAAEVDPTNKLLHRARVRRLQAEAIRDSMLAVSRRLDRTLYGKPVPVALDAFQGGRGRPGSGPLDGKGRRSVYLSVRRNFLHAMLLAFDFPQPFSTMGRRSVSNVPAQALILRNHPFVHNQAEVWAKRLEAEKTSPRKRVAGMFVTAFGRPATPNEISAALKFLEDMAGLKASGWKELAHALFQAKEFIYLN